MYRVKNQMPLLGRRSAHTLCPSGGIALIELIFIIPFYSRQYYSANRLYL